MADATYYIVKSDEGINSLKSLLGSKSADGNCIAVLWNSSHASSLREFGIKYLLIEGYAAKVDFNSIRRQAQKLIKSFPHKKLLGNKSLIELLEHDGYSLWWFIRQGFYSHCIAALKDAKAMRLLVKKNNVKRLVVFGHDESLVSAVKESAGKAKVTIQKTSNKSLIRSAKLRFSDLFPKFVRVAQGFIRSFQFSGKKNGILLYTRSHKFSTIAKNTKGDSDSYTILRQLESGKHSVIPLDLAINKEAAWKAIKNKNPYMPYDYFVFKSFFDFAISKKICPLEFRLRKLWKSLDGNERFRQLLVCDGVSLYPILRNQIKAYFCSSFGSLVGAARNFEIGKKMIERLGIRLAACIDENGTSRFLVFASRAKGIPCIALQHGTIGEMSIAYNYSKSDLYGLGSLNCQLADRTAVFGGYYRKLLMEIGNYEKSMLAVTGQPRTDILFANRKKYSKKILCSRLGLDPNKKLVVFASQAIKEEESKVNFTALVNALKKVKNSQLAVKLHPNDNDVIYKKISSELEYKCAIARDVDLYELLFCSDLVFSIYSTVMLEALLMDKPVIQLNLLEKYDLFPKSKNDFILKITKEDGLTQAIGDLLSNQSKFRGMEKARRKFVLEHYNHLDGDATGRFIDILEEVLEK